MSESKQDRQISSADKNLLLLCESYLDNLLSFEVSKSQRTEDKAMRLLGLCGLGATALAGVGGYLKTLPTSGMPIHTLNYWLILAGVALVTRATALILRAVKPGKGYQLNEQFVYECQGLGETEALRDLVKTKAWLYPHAVDFTLGKLFLFHCAVRNVVALMSIVIAVGMLNMYEGHLNPILARATPYLPHFVGLFVGLFALRLDWFADRYDHLWSRGGQNDNPVSGASDPTSTGKSAENSLEPSEVDASESAIPSSQ